MNDKFDELAKGLAQSVTRRQALRRFAAGVAAALMATIGLPNKAEAKRPGPGNCHNDNDCAYLGPAAFCGWCVGNGSYRWRCCLVPPP